MAGEFTSNLLTNPELAGKFHQEALSVALSLRSKYYSVFQFMSPEDVVQECWSKICRQNISFDEEKGCKFETFVRMMVNNRCIDMGRRVKRHEGVLSLDEEFQTSSGDTVPLTEFIPDKSGDFEGLQDLISVIDSVCDDFSGVDVKSILKMRQEGFQDREIAKEVGLKAKEVKEVVGQVFDAVERRCACQRTLADVLYGDESELYRQQDKLVCTLSNVKDRKSGLRLSDVVKMVIEGATYNQIGQRFNMPGQEVKGFLDRYHELVI